MDPGNLQSSKFGKPGQTKTPGVLWVFLAAMSFGLGLLVIVSFVSKTPLGIALTGSLYSLFAIDSVQLMWYITRSAGLIAYLLLWLSTAWGLAVSNKILDRMLHRTFTYDFHQYISLLSIGFIVLHIAVLTADRYLPYSLAEILVPFLSPYRPLWVGVGGLAFYITLLVTVTFYLRSRIGMRAFRAIHVLSLVAYLGSAVHGFFAGTDSSLLATQVMYAGTFLVVVFLTAFWLLTLLHKRSQPVAPASHQVSPAVRARQLRRS